MVSHRQWQGVLAVVEGVLKYHSCQHVGGVVVIANVVLEVLLRGKAVHCGQSTRTHIAQPSLPLERPGSVRALQMKASSLSRPARALETLRNKWLLSWQRLRLIFCCSVDQGGIVGLQQGHVTENCHKAGQGLQAKAAAALSCSPHPESLTPDHGTIHLFYFILLLLDRVFLYSPG